MSKLSVEFDTTTTTTSMRFVSSTHVWVLGFGQSHLIVVVEDKLHVHVDQLEEGAEGDEGGQLAVGEAVALLPVEVVDVVRHAQVFHHLGAHPAVAQSHQARHEKDGEAMDARAVQREQKERLCWLVSSGGGGYSNKNIPGNVRSQRKHHRVVRTTLSSLCVKRTYTERPRCECR